MFDIKKGDSSKPKCYFTKSVLPAFVDHDQVPVKKLPFATVNRQKCSHTLDVALPRTTSNDFQKTLAPDSGILRYLKVYMKLADILSGEFFNEYVKSGNILMLSQGRQGIDQNFSLSEGILRLEVDKATFQRCGLEGKPVADNGRKHVHSRYAMEFNLRLPSMVRGKHGFQRIIWAVTNVLNDTTTWLFFDFKGPNDGSGPIAAHQPKVLEVEPLVDNTVDVIVPNFEGEHQPVDYAESLELLEWLSLVTSSSARVQDSDRIDSHLSRYQVPGLHDDSRSVQDVVRWRWHGLIPATFVQKIILCALTASGSEWFILSATAFDDRSYAILQHKQQTLTWEYED